MASNYPYLNYWKQKYLFNKINKFSSLYKLPIKERSSSKVLSGLLNNSFGRSSTTFKLKTIFRADEMHY